MQELGQKYFNRFEVSGGLSDHGTLRLSHLSDISVDGNFQGTPSR